jgi:hypothetical protein
MIRRSTTAPQSVIAQQYSSAKFVSLPFYSHKEKFGSRFKHVPLYISSSIF